MRTTTILSAAALVIAGCAPAAANPERTCEDATFDSGNVFSICEYSAPVICVEADLDLTIDDWAISMDVMPLSVTDRGSVVVAHPEMGSTPQGEWMFMSEWTPVGDDQLCVMSTALFVGVNG